MPTITRPVKTGGTTRYTDEVTAGFDTIKATEVDADVDLAYQTINALDDANIVTGANIAGSKIVFADNTINGSKLVDASVGVAKLVNASITTGKLAVGAAIHQFVKATGTASWDITPATTLCAQMTWAPRSPSSEIAILAYGNGSTELANGAGASRSCTHSFKLYLGGTAGVADGTLVETAGNVIARNAIPDAVIDFPLHPILTFAGVTPETRVKMFVTTTFSGGGTTIVTAALTTSLLLLEFA